jgi:carbon storage regulator
MLILTRRVSESIIIETSDGTIEVVICKINGGQVRVGIQAPDSVDIWREEIPEESAA